MKPTPPTLSVAIIAANSRPNFERLFPSIAFADQIVVVVSNSTDDTAEFARRQGATVKESEWLGFAKLRNLSLEMSVGDWVLVVDHDEVVSDELAAEIRLAITSAELEAYELPFRNHVGNKVLRHGGWAPDYHLRLFKRGSGRFVGEIHEKLTGPKKIGRLANPIDHYPYASIADWLEKVNRYTTVEAAEKPFSVDRLLLKPAATFLRSYVLWSGYRDGMLGFVASSIGAWYKFVVEIKRWERR